MGKRKDGQKNTNPDSGTDNNTEHKIAKFAMPPAVALNADPPKLVPAQFASKVEPAQREAKKIEPEASEAGPTGSPDVEHGEDAQRMTSAAEIEGAVAPSGWDSGG